MNHKLKEEEARDCNPEEHKLYGSIVMKMDLLATDRPDIQWSMRTCAKRMPKPDVDRERRELSRYFGFVLPSQSDGGGL